MDHMKAQEITESYKPSLVNDPRNQARPNTFVVRRRPPEGVTPTNWPAFSFELMDDESFKKLLDQAEAELPPLELPDADPA